MKMAGLLWCVLGVLLANAQSATGITELRMPACTSHGWMEIDETALSVPVTCTGIPPDHSIAWRSTTSQGSTLIGTCSSVGNCNHVRLSRPNESTSILSLTPSRQQAGIDLQCSVPGSGTPPASCGLNIVYPPSASEVSCSIAPSPSSRWQITGSCHVTKAYSSRNHYTCDLRQGSATGPSVATANYSSGSSGNYTSGTCTLTAAMPTTTGNYSYAVIVSPGQRAVTPSGTITVARPTADPVMTCLPQGQYVPVNTDLNCTCSAPDLGHPKGRLRVFRGNSEKVSGNYGEVSVRLREVSVGREDDGTVYRCELEWTTTDNPRDTAYTLHVAYGPANASLPQPEVFDLHPTSPGTLTLTCSASDFQPNVSYSWTGSRCSGVTQNTCFFTPTTSDNGDVINCTAINTVTRVSKTSASRTLIIHYPPSDPPDISGYRQGEIIYSGQTRNLTCSVRGGSPTVSAVTFTCEGHGQEVSGASSSVSVTGSRDYNGRRCRCSAKWKNKNPPWYTLTDDVSITVYYPPERPSISHRDQRVPFLAGQSPTLYCSLPAGPDAGNPPATLTFSRTSGGQGQGQVSVTLEPLTETDDGRKMTCEASNNFTEHTNTPRRGEYIIKVYYVSTPAITHLPTDSCDMTSPNTCIVREGERVHVNCSARSNPPVKSVTWQQSGNSVLDLVANRSLPLSYECDVTTKTNGSDDRLPLRNSTELTVLTTYTAEIEQWTANGRQHNLTVNESGSVTVNCTAVGRPTPSVTITKDGQSLEHLDKGQHVTPLQTASLTHRVSEATCDVTGTFACQVDNGLGSQRTERVTVFVNCSPRQESGSPEPTDYLNFNGDPLMVQFSVIAFPPQLNHRLDYLKALNSTPERAPERLFAFNCDSIEDTLHKQNCTLIVANVTRGDSGYYNLTLMNDYGEFSWQFQLDVNATKGQAVRSDRFPIGAAVGGGLAVAVAVIIAIAVVILILRRRKKGKESSDEHSHRLRQKRSREEQDGDSEMIVNTLYATSGNTGPYGNCDDDGEMIVNTIYESSDVTAPRTTNKPHLSGNAYEDVEVVRSVPSVKKEEQTTVRGGSKSTMDKPPGAASNTEDSSLYATVDKSKKAVTKPAVKPKPTRNGKENKQERQKEKTTRKNDVYSNTTLLSMEPKGTDGTVYENCAFQDDESSTVKTAEPSATSVNPDGLVYTTIAFSKDQQKKADQFPPAREATEYADINIGKLVKKSE